MKNMKRLFALLVAIMILVAGVAAYAEAPTTPAGNTITVQNAVNGEKYNIYKMLDLSVSGLDTESTADDSYRYTINEKWNAFWTGTGAGAAYITTNTSGSDTYVVWKDDMKSAAKMEAFGKAAAAFAATVEADGTEVTAQNDTAAWTGLDNGYYLVTSTLGIAASVASTPATQDNVISEKNSGNTTDKEVEEAEERNGTAASWGDANDAQIGDTVNFRAKVSIAKNSIKVVYHDKMGQELDWTGIDHVKVYTSTEFTEANELAAENYTVAAGTNGEDTFTVAFADSYVASLTDATTDVWVSYSAVLNDKAAVASNVPNDGKVTWGEAGTTNWDHTDTTTHKFQILKYDGADANKNPLDGAKFQLFTKNTDENNPALKLCVNGDGTIYRVVDTTNAGATLPEGYTLVNDDKIVTLATDKITVEGVDSDDYYLKETDAPAGFNAIEGYIKVEVNADNNLIKEVENNSGNTLPSTGGVGTTIFYVGGSILVIAAVILLVTKRRMSTHD